MKIICSVVQDSLLRFPEITGCFYYVSGRMMCFILVCGKTGAFYCYCSRLLPSTVTEQCNRNIKSYKYIYIYKYRCTPKQSSRPKIQVCFPVTACTGRFLCILVHSSSAYPEMFLLFFFFFQTKQEEVENQTTIEEVEWLTTCSECFLSRPPQKVLLMLHPLIHLSGTQCRLETHFSDIT